MTGPQCFQEGGDKTENRRKFYCDHNRTGERNGREWMWDWDWGWNWGWIEVEDGRGLVMWKTCG